MASDERIIAALARLPGAAERIASARIEDGVATLVLDVTGLDAEAAATLEREAKEAVGGIAGIRTTRIAATASRRDRTVVAIGSGKGGVGKSTLAANLAVALARKGHKVGLVDADIYGPSQPRIMGCELRPEAVGKKMIPLEAHGVRMLSIGQLVEPGSALAWRGPMVSQALAQLMDGDWSGVDLLLVDLPPGTGDIHLSLLQKYRPQGAVVVSTPQDLALIDARRAIDLFGKLHVPMLGIVENMAGFACPACGTVSEPFGAGGAERAAGELGMPFLGSIPLAMPIRIASDSGTPPAAGSGPEADAFARLADGLLEQLARLRVAKQEGAA